MDPDDQGEKMILLIRQIWRHIFFNVIIPQSASNCFNYQCPLIDINGEKWHTMHQIHRLQQEQRFGSLQGLKNQLNMLVAGRDNMVIVERNEDGNRYSWFFSLLFYISIYVD